MNDKIKFNTLYVLTHEDGKEEEVYPFDGSTWNTAWPSFNDGFICYHGINKQVDDHKVASIMWFKKNAKQKESKPEFKRVEKKAEKDSKFGFSWIGGGTSTTNFTNHFFEAYKPKKYKIKKLTTDDNTEATAPATPVARPIVRTVDEIVTDAMFYDDLATPTQLG